MQPLCNFLLFNLAAIREFICDKRRVTQTHTYKKHPVSTSDTYTPIRGDTLYLQVTQIHTYKRHPVFASDTDTDLYETPLFAKESRAQGLDFEKF
jgi:hypothetical protein